MTQAHELSCLLKPSENYNDQTRRYTTRPYTCDANGNILTCKNSDGYWYEYTLRRPTVTCLLIRTLWGLDEYTYDDHGNELTYKDSDGYWYEYTRDDHGNILTYKDSDGRWREYARDDHGKMLTLRTLMGTGEYTRDATVHTYL